MRAGLLTSVALSALVLCGCQHTAGVADTSSCSSGNGAMIGTLLGAGAGAFGGRMAARKFMGGKNKTAATIGGGLLGALAGNIGGGMMDSPDAGCVKEAQRRARQENDLEIERQRLEMYQQHGMVPPGVAPARYPAQAAAPQGGYIPGQPEVMFQDPNNYPPVPPAPSQGGDPRLFTQYYLEMQQAQAAQRSGRPLSNGAVVPPVPEYEPQMTEPQSSVRPIMSTLTPVGQEEFAKPSVAPAPTSSLSPFSMPMAGQVSEGPPPGVDPRDYYNLRTPPGYIVNKPPTEFPPGTYYDPQSRMYVVPEPMDPHVTDPSRVAGPNQYPQTALRRNFYPIDPNSPPRPAGADYQNYWNERNPEIIMGRTEGNFFHRGPQFFQVPAPPPR